MRPSVVPGFSDLAGLVAFVLRDPYLFISSSTVMTTAILAVLVFLSVLSLRVAPLSRALERPAAALALVFAYFGLGSLALSTEILVRFHAAIPVETETQFVSGLGHFAVGAAGALMAWRLAAGGRPRWLLANAIALLYWTLQIVILDPPWFSFQGQGESMRTAALATIAALTLATAIGARLSPRPLTARVTRELTSGSGVRRFSARR
jgi:hypothetical protein